MIERLAAADVLGRELDAIREVWTRADELRLEDILPRHASREGFTFLAARDEGRLVGFAYGYLGEPGQWWHDVVAAAMDDEQRGRWLRPGHVELVELHVHPAFRRHGLGGALHDAFLAAFAEAPVAVLSTQVDNEPALALYRGRGWEVVVPRLRFSEAGEPFSILGRELAE